MKNNRLRDRVPFQTEVILTIGKTNRKFNKTRDISMNGLFIETKDVIPLNQEGKMELLLSCGASKITVKSKFRVLRVVDLKKGNKKKPEPSGFGIYLFDFEGDSCKELYNIIRYNRGGK